MIVYLILFTAGVGAGFINTLAGGGSTLTLTALIFFGLDSGVANATNRIGILIQNAAGVYNFNKHLDLKKEVLAKIHIFIMAICGGIIGSFFAAEIESHIFDKIIVGVFIFLLVLMILPKSNRNNNKKKIPFWIESLIFLIVGLYGGFIQVGIGFILLASLNLIESYDLVKANAIKLVIVLFYTIPVVVVFAFKSEIVWQYGLMLGSGTILGSYIGVKAAIKKGAKVVKIVLILAMLLAIFKLIGGFQFLSSQLSGI